MPRLKYRLSFETLLSSFSAVSYLLLTQCCAGQTQVVGPSQPIVAIAGDDIILPCHLDPAVDASEMTVEWARPDLDPRFVYVWRDGVELEIKKHLSYRGRTSLSSDKLKLGDVSLKLSKVKLSDEGRYRCFIPTLARESTVELVVGVVSFIAISIGRTEKDKVSSGSVVLDCKSEGWYPEPEVLWLDGEGNLLPAGPTETVRGPDDLYTVSSRVTVEKRHSNSFTCRVQQNNINQTRETEIRIQEDVFMVPSYSAVRIIVVLSVGFLLFSAVFFVFWKLTQNKGHIKMHHDTDTEDGRGGRKQLVRGSTKMKDLDKEKLEEKEEEKKDLIHVVSLLMEEKKELEISRDKHTSQLEKVEGEWSENEKKLKSNNKYWWNKDDKKNRLLVSKLEKEKTEHQKFLQCIEERLQETLDVITRMTEKKKKVQNQIEQMKKQLEEAERERESELLERKEETNTNTDLSTVTEGQRKQNEEA